MKSKKKISIISILTIILILFLVGFSMGKGIYNTKINAKASIAKPIIEVVNGKEIEITNSKNKGSYDFSVRNFDNEGKINETNLFYNIEIVSNLSEAIDIKIYKENQELSLENNKTEEMKLSHSIKQEDFYRIEVTYDKNKNLSIEEIIQDIQIKIHSEQEKT